MMHRLFVALRPPPAIRAGLIATMGGIGDARWQSDDQLHLTTRYIGEVDRRMAEDVTGALGQIHAARITCRLSGVGRFARQGRTDTIWAGIAPVEPLAALHHKVDRALSRIGLPADARAYLPHVTLARMARSLLAEAEIDAFLVRQSALWSPDFHFDHLFLFESHLTRDGARYEMIERWPLIA